MIRRVVLSVLLAAALPAHATNGYFSHGYGMRAKGQAGAGIAQSQDALVIATNPAGLSGVQDGFELGIDFFAPSRGSVVRQGGTTVKYEGNGERVFFIPEFGYSRHVGDRLAVGLALYGNGGMNTDYDVNPYGRFGAQGKMRMDLSQAFVAPALAYKVTPTQSIGIALNLAYQRFETQGLGLFGGFSVSPGNVSNRGYDDSTGWGVRVGWTGQFGDRVTLGATWQSKTWMSRFKDYSGLFEGRGSFDIPETYGLGISLRATDKLTLALDWQETLYSEVPAVGNSSALLFAGVPLGADNGPGFGWRDVSTWKLGAAYAFSDAFTLRGGVSRNSQPIPAQQTFINIIAPGVVRTHATLGGTWKLGDRDALNVAYMHAFRETVTGSGSIPPSFGGGEVDNYLSENSLGVSWSRRF